MSLNEKLIILVEQYSALYDTSCELYHNKLAKEKCWETIAKNLNIQVYEVKEKWRFLRDKYVRQKKKIQSVRVSGSSRVEVSKWPLMNCMDFLEPYIQPRRTVSNNENADVVLEADFSTLSSKETPIDVQILSEPEQEEDREESFFNSHDDSFQTSASGLSSRLGKKRKNKNLDFIESKSLRLMDKSDHSEELFVRSLVPAMKRLQPKKLSEFKVAMLTLLHKFEYDDK